MCVCSTAKRRRRQAKQKYNHLAPRQRPNYSMTASSGGERRGSKGEGKKK